MPALQLHILEHGRHFPADWLGRLQADLPELQTTTHYYRSLPKHFAVAEGNAHVLLLTDNLTVSSIQFASSSAGEAGATLLFRKMARNVLTSPLSNTLGRIGLVQFAETDETYELLVLKLKLAIQQNRRLQDARLVTSAWTQVSRISQPTGQHLKAILNNLPTILIVLDEQGRILLNSGRGLEALGLKERDWLGHNVLTVLEDRPEWQQDFRRVIAGDSFSEERTWDDRHYHVHYTPYLDSEGRNSGAIAVAIDITEAQIARQALLRQQDLMKSILDTLPIGITIKDALGRFVFVNTETQRQLDLPPVDIIGKTDWDIYPTEIAARFVADDASSRRSSKPIVREEDLPKPSGRGTRTLLAGKVALKIDPSLETLLLGYSVDISERKRFERTLQEQSHLIQTVIDADPNLIFLKDAEGRFLLVNQAVADLFGSTKAELIQRHNSQPEKEQLLGPQAFFSHIDRQVIKTRQEFILEENITLKDGTIRWFQMLKKPLEDADGRVNVLGIGMDITQRKLDTQALIHARRVAEESTQAKERFLANMSHEIRTPLNGLVGLAELLDRTRLDPTQREYVLALKQSASVLLLLINDILDLSKIGAGRMELEAIDFDLLELVTQLRNQHLSRAAEKGIGLQFNIVDSVPHGLHGDPGRLGQILSNLVSNAIKFTERGSVELAIDAQGIEDQQIRLVFTVTDTGIGISSTRLDSIFDSFSQASADISRKYGGTGLGLAIVRELSNLMGGGVTVESVEGKGSVFTVRLPLRLAEKPLPSAKKKTLPKQKASLQGSVLLVEDNAVNRLIANKLLTDWGLTVTEATNGLEAIECARNQAFDIILMDLSLPEMDGHEATRIIRRDFPQPARNTPILALTAQVMSNERERSLLSGMNGYLAKPYNPADLLDEILRLCPQMLIQTARPQKELSRKRIKAVTPPEHSAQMAQQLDLTFLRSFFDGDERQVMDIIKLSEEVLREELKTFEAMVQQPQRPADLLRLAHKLKSLTRQLGARVLSNLLESLEKCSPNNEAEIKLLADQALLDLQALLNEVTQELHPSGI